MAFARVSSTCLARSPLLCASIACALYARLRFRSLRMDRPARRRKASSSNRTLATCESRSTPAARLMSFRARRWLWRAFLEQDRMGGVDLRARAEAGCKQGIHPFAGGGVALTAAGKVISARPLLPGIDNAGHRLPERSSGLS